MYEGDYAHATATQSNESRLWQDYRKLRKKQRVLSRSERISISMIFIHSAGMTRKLWSEIKRPVPGKDKHLHITCDITAKDFNPHFANISNKMNSKFQNCNDNCFWKGPKSIHGFRCKEMSNEDIKTYMWDLYLMNPIMRYWA